MAQSREKKREREPLSENGVGVHWGKGGQVLFPEQICRETSRR